jgi:hypothetical protein
VEVLSHYRASISTPRPVKHVQTGKSGGSGNGGYTRLTARDALEFLGQANGVNGKILSIDGTRIITFSINCSAKS